MTQRLVVEYSLILLSRVEDDHEVGHLMDKPLRQRCSHRVVDGIENGNLDLVAHIALRVALR
jgi:hypothetical protein